MSLVILVLTSIEWLYLLAIGLFGEEKISSSAVTLKTDHRLPGSTQPTEGPLDTENNMMSSRVLKDLNSSRMENLPKTAQKNVATGDMFKEFDKNSMKNVDVGGHTKQDMDTSLNSSFFVEMTAFGAKDKKPKQDSP
jgi:hypothetical protein